MDYQQILVDEYKKAKKKPVYCLIGSQKVIVPVSYNGNKDQFIDDIFRYDIECRKYDEYNNECLDKNQILDPKMIKSGEISFLPPLKLLLEGCSEKEIIKKASSEAIRRYHSAIKKIVRARKENPKKHLLTSMNAEYVANLEKLHQKYCATQLAKGLGKGLRFSTEQTAQIASGIVGILPVAIYKLLDKKYHFASTKAKRIIDKKVIPYVCKGALKSLIPLTLIGGIKMISSNGANQESSRGGISSEIQDTPQNKVLTTKYKITDAESFAQLYNAAFPFIVQSMLPTEILVCDPYSDNCKTVNTIGIGSYWYPQNGNPKSSEWIKTSQYVEKYPKIKIDGQKAYDLADGWFRYRENGRIYKEMFRRLQGCELNICEFSSIATCTYNDEANGKELCSYVHDNYQDPIACAAKLMSLKPGNSSFNDGISKRHAHEALLYLNIDNYSEKMQHFVVKKGKNSKGKIYYVSSVTQLNAEECQPMLNDLLKGKTDEAGKLAQKIFNYTCKDGKPIYQIAKENGIDSVCLFQNNNVELSSVARRMQADSLYTSAIKAYKDKNYEQALQGFKNMIEAGFNGADIHNDMAITYYNMGRYEECIAECQEVLNTGESEQYAAANYNAGKSYEAMNNYVKAQINYELALKREQNNKTYQNAVNQVKSKRTQLTPPKKNNQRK